MDNGNKSLFEMMEDGNYLFGDSFHFWLETKYGMPIKYQVSKQDVNNLRDEGKIQCICGGSKDFYRVKTI